VSAACAAILSAERKYMPQFTLQMLLTSHLAGLTLQRVYLRHSACGPLLERHLLVGVLQQHAQLELLHLVRQPLLQKWNSIACCSLQGSK
jgi:hypothetical protein